MGELTLDDMLRLCDKIEDAAMDIMESLQRAQDMAEHEAERTVKFDER